MVEMSLDLEQLQSISTVRSCGSQDDGRGGILSRGNMRQTAWGGGRTGTVQSRFRRPIVGLHRLSINGGHEMRYPSTVFRVLGIDLGNFFVISINAGFEFQRLIFHDLIQGYSSVLESEVGSGPSPGLETTGTPSGSRAGSCHHAADGFIALLVNLMKVLSGMPTVVVLIFGKFIAANVIIDNDPTKERDGFPLPFFHWFPRR